MLKYLNKQHHLSSLNVCVGCLLGQLCMASVEGLNAIVRYGGQVIRAIRSIVVVSCLSGHSGEQWNWQYLISLQHLLYCSTLCIIIITL